MADDIQLSAHKRKYDDGGVSPASDAATPTARRATGFSAPIASSESPAAALPPSYNSVPPPLDGIQLAKQRAQEIAARLLSDAEAKRPRVENGGPGDDAAADKGFSAPASDLSHLHKPVGQQMANSQVNMGSSASFATYGYPGTSKKIEIPNSKVGVIIGKGGETIRYLQLQSGAKIQVTRDAEVDPGSQTRIVELMGTTEQIDRAEQLINDVLREAEAGGSGTAAARKFVGVETGSEQFTMKVPNNRVGLLIGKGGETIKSMQAKSGARIQIIPLHLPPGDTSAERNVQIDGTKEQIESAKQLINEVISENRVRNPPGGGGYPQQSYRPPQAPSSWGPPGPPPMQQPGYGYMQPGAYPGPPLQYNASQPPYGGYPPPTSVGYSGGWDQSTPGQQATPGTGYDYYNQQQPQQQPPHVAGSTAPDGGAYNYGQSQPSTYSAQGSYNETAYSQPHAVPPQGYGQDGYSGGYPAPGPQSGYAHTQSNAQPLYDQQQNYGSAPAYGAAPQDGSTATYSAQSGTGQAPLAQPPPASQPAVTQQGFPSQQPSSTPASYPSQFTGQPGYGMPQSQPASQPPSTGYGQTPPLSQPNYAQPPQGQKTSPTQPLYGQSQQPTNTQGGYAQTFPGPPAGYGQPPPYGVPPRVQQGYVQQLQQPYGDSYGSENSGGYSQPPAHSSGGEVGGAPAAQPVPSGTTQASPQS